MNSVKIMCYINVRVAGHSTSSTRFNKDMQKTARQLKYRLLNMKIWSSPNADRRWLERDRNILSRQDCVCAFCFPLTSQMAPGSKRWENKPAEHEHKKQTGGCFFLALGSWCCPWAESLPWTRGTHGGRWQMDSPDQLAMLWWGR